MIGYKERCDQKRQTYLQKLAVLKTSGKSVVYADESGFRQESHRRYAYAPRGEFKADAKQKTSITGELKSYVQDSLQITSLSWIMPAYTRHRAHENL